MTSCLHIGDLAPVIRIAIDVVGLTETEERALAGFAPDVGIRFVEARANMAATPAMLRVNRDVLASAVTAACPGVTGDPAPTTILIAVRETLPVAAMLFRVTRVAALSAVLRILVQIGLAAVLCIVVAVAEAVNAGVNDTFIAHAGRSGIG